MSLPKVQIKYYEDTDYAQIIANVAELARMNKSELLRMAIRIGLPQVIERLGLKTKLSEDEIKVIEVELLNTLEELRHIVETAPKRN